MLVAGSLFSTVGCATKKYVQSQITPINNKIGELDEISSKNSSDIKDVDGKAQQGIQAANQADQKALAAGDSADQANQKANHVASGLNGLAGNGREPRQLQAGRQYDHPVRIQQSDAHQGRPADAG